MQERPAFDRLERRRHENPRVKHESTLIPERYLDNQQAAHYLKLSPRTLDRQRLTGEGPRFRKFGRRVIYAIEDLEAWANERISRASP